MSNFTEQDYFLLTHSFDMRPASDAARQGYHCMVIVDDAYTQREHDRFQDRWENNPNFDNSGRSALISLPRDGDKSFSRNAVVFNSQWLAGVFTRCAKGIWTDPGIMYVEPVSEKNVRLKYICEAPAKAPKINWPNDL